jgi:deazaflavin-dependent oxidoreductase (nitroreductase family)
MPRSMKCCAVDPGTARIVSWRNPETQPKLLHTRSITEHIMATKVEPGTPGWQQRHVEIYHSSDGAEGHVLDFGRPGVPLVNCLLLQTTGRKSHAPKVTPLIYGKDGTRFVIVASRGGAPTHPAWFLNLKDQPEVRFQVGDKKYRGMARSVSGAERERLFRMMAGLYPPYVDYQEKTTREIPVVVLEPQGEVERL